MISFLQILKQKLRKTFPFLDKWYSSLIYPLSYLRYKKCLRSNLPYFGPYMSAKQGNPVRHAYMNQVVKQECMIRGDRPFRVFEIGSWAGGSAITWAQAIKSHHRGNGVVVCVDPWEPSPNLKGNQGKHYRRMTEALASGAIFRLFVHNIRASGQNDIVYPVKAPAEQILPFFSAGQFDMVFVDGDHHYSSVSRDLKNCMPLVADGGILCGDDLELQLSQVDVSHLHRMLEVDYIQDPKTGKWFHPGVALAVNEMFGEVTAWSGFWAMRRHGSGWKGVSLNVPDPRIPGHLANRI